MKTYPKHILSINDQIQTYIDGGLIITNMDEVKEALMSIGYYRLRGYSFHLYNKTIKQYQNGISFSDILRLYQFDIHLSGLLLSMILIIEVALRARFIDAFLKLGDPLIYLDSSVFTDKQNFWSNIASISNEVARSRDVFIEHNFKKHDGQVPIWAIVEVMSFGTLSKTIKNLQTSGSAQNTPFKALVSHYSFTGKNSAKVIPNMEMLSTWIHTVSILRNMCAHNSRIYNKRIDIKPTILYIDQQNPNPTYYGLYQAVLAMKYLRLSNLQWNDFVNNIEMLFNAYSSIVDLTRINFPSDWKQHLIT